MDSTINAAALPWDTVENVTFSSGEEINYTTINEKILRLLENDFMIFQLKKNLSNISILDYDKLIEVNGKIDKDDLVWLNKDEPFSRGDFSKKINVGFPIVPDGITEEKMANFPKPTTRPPELSAFHAYLEEQIADDQPLNSYDTVLYHLQNFLLDPTKVPSMTEQDVTKRPNILRYDAGYYLALNKDDSINRLYEMGYRWVEGFLTRDCLDEISAFTKNVKLPYTSLADAWSSPRYFSPDKTYDMGTTFAATQYLFIDNKQRLLTNYPNGKWIKKYGSRWAKQGGIATLQYELSGSNLTEISSSTHVDFLVPFKQCYKVNIQAYNNFTSQETVSATISAATFSPIYITQFNETGFDVKSYPDYVMADGTKDNSVTYNNFNYVWEAEGII